MRKKALNYRIIIEKEKNKKGYVYVSQVPSLGISDFGKTVEETIKNTEKAINLYLKAISDIKGEIPNTDSDEFFVVNKKINFKIPYAMT